MTFNTRFTQPNGNEFSVYVDANSVQGAIAEANRRHPELGFGWELDSVYQEDRNGDWAQVI